MSLISTRQLSFIENLRGERILTGINLPANLDTLTKEQASELIGTLLNAPRPLPENAPAPAIPAGRYAVESNGILTFYVVDHGKGRWAGRVFVSRQSSDNLLRIGMVEQRSALALIEADPRGATVRYGRELGVCGVCGRALTDEESRAAGIGPVCAARI